MQSRYLIVPLGTEIGKWWLLAHQVTALQYVVTGLTKTEIHHKQQPAFIVNNTIPIRVQFCVKCVLKVLCVWILVSNVQNLTKILNVR